LQILLLRLAPRLPAASRLIGPYFRDRRFTE